MGLADLKAIEILDDLLYGYILLPGVRDAENRDLMMFPVPNKGQTPTYTELETVSNYLISIPRKSVLNNGMVALIDTTDGDWTRIEDIIILIQQIQAKNPGQMTLIHIIAKPNYKTKTREKIRDMSRTSGIEVQVHTIEELSQILPACSLVDIFGGSVTYDNNTWVRFRLNVEPFLSDCQSMGRRLEDLVRPLTDVDSIISDSDDVKMVSDKYKEMQAETMKNLHIDQLLNEGKKLIERYEDVAKTYPDMQDTLHNISSALSHLKTLQYKIDNLATVGHSKAEHMATYMTFKKHCDQLLTEIKTQHKQLENMTEQGLYDVSSVETSQSQLTKLRLHAENLHTQVKHCIKEGRALPNKGQVQRDVKLLQSTWDKLSSLHDKKKDVYADMLSFHQLVEECMSWFFSGIQRFTSQPVMQCNTLEGICALEQELDRHLSRCPIQGYQELDNFGTKIGSRAAISRVKMIKTKFSAFQEIVKARQDYLRKLKLNLIQKTRNNVDNIRERTTMTGLHIRDNRYEYTKTAKDTQWDLKDILGYSRNSSNQTNLTCICINDRIKHLSSRISNIERRLNLTDRSVSNNSQHNNKEQLALILKRINIIENFLKRLRFSTVYDSFYSHSEKFSSKNSSDILNDLQNDSVGDSGFNSRPATEQTLSNRPDIVSPKITSPPLTPQTTARSSTVVSPKSGEYEDPMNNVYNILNLSDDTISGPTIPDSSTISGQSSPISVRQYSRNKSSSINKALSASSPSFNVPTSTPLRPEQPDFINEKLVEIEKLLIDIEHEVHHDLKVDGETQTGEAPEHSDSSSQTETDSDESIGVQYSVETSISSTQYELEVSAQSVQCSPLVRSTSTDTGVVHVTSGAQHTPTNYKTTHSQTPAKHFANTCSQYTPFIDSKGVQHYNIGSDIGVQNCPVHSHTSTQSTPLSSQTSSQTSSPDVVSTESQSSSDNSNTSTQTAMIGLFPASMQTDIQHFAAKKCQTEIKTEEKGVCVAPHLADKSESADIKAANHKESVADIKCENHQATSADIKWENHISVGTAVETATRGTAAKFIKMFSKAVETPRKISKQMEVQTEVKQTNRAQDTSDMFHSENKTTETANLVFYDTESTQTTLFEPVLVSTPAQTEADTTLIKSEMSAPTVTQFTQTAHETETDAGEDGTKPQKFEIEVGKRKPLHCRSEPHMSFRDVSYNKNKTHELRVAKIKRNQEAEQRAKDKVKKVPKKRAPKKKEDKELKCTCDEAACAPILSSLPPPPPELISEGTLSPEPLLPSPPSPISPIPMLPSPTGLITSASITPSRSQLFTPVPSDTETPSEPLQIMSIEEHSEYEEEEEEEEDEEDWSQASIIFPVEESPSPLTQRSESKYKLGNTNLSKKLQYVLQEMLDTEEAYVRDLSHVVKGYIEPMEQHTDKTVNNLADLIFVYFRQICSFHSDTFQNSLVTAATCPTAPMVEVANTFIRHEQELALYLSFMVQERKSSAIVQQNHEGFIKEQEGRLGDTLGLASYLIKPTQRMVKYKQFLDIMLAATEDFEIVEEVATAQTLIGNILNTTNDLCHLQALELPENLTADVTGELIKQGEFKVAINGEQKQRQRRVFLFEGMIVLAKADVSVEEKYRTKDTVGMDEIGLTPYLADEPLKCHLWTSQSTYTMYASSEATAREWSDCISNILWGQLKQIKRDRDMSRIRKTRGKGSSRGARGLLRARRDLM